MRHIRLRIAALLLAIGLLCSACADPDNTVSAGYEDVSEILQQAEYLYQEGKYTDSLEQYLTAMERNVKDMDARFGAVKCQIELGNYEIAAVNLTMAQQVDPKRIEICELYLELSQRTERISYARSAVALAAQYGHESILDAVPEKPSFDIEPGDYTERIWLSIRSQDADAKVYVTLSNSENQNYNLYNTEYSNPIALLRGENTVSVYAIRDGIPSETVTATYTVRYGSYEVTFKEPLIEKLVRLELGISSGPITNYDCEKVTMLNWYDLSSTVDSYSEYKNLKITSLEDMQYLPGLQDFSLEYQTEITDYSPLKNCPMIYWVQFYECGLTDTEVVKYVPNVTYLYLSNNKISDFSGLEGLTDLYSLNIDSNDGNGTVDQVLRNNKNIRYLNINDTQLEDYSVLYELENLVQLSIRGVAFVDYAAVGQLTNLERLNISYDYNRREYGAKIGDISFLPNMQNLQYLYLNGVNDTADLEYIKQLSNLSTLYLYSCSATSDQSAMKSLEQTIPNCAISY